MIKKTFTAGTLMVFFLFLSTLPGFARISIKPNGVVTTGSTLTVRITLEQGKKSVKLQMWRDINGSKRADKGDKMAWDHEITDGMSTGVLRDRCPDKNVIEVEIRISERFPAGGYIVRETYAGTPFARGAVLTIAKKIEGIGSLVGRPIRGGTHDPLLNMMIMKDRTIPSHHLAGSDLFLLDLGTLKTTPLTDTADCIDPACSADGKHIAYVRNYENKSELWVLTLGKDGTLKKYKKLAGNGKNEKSIMSPVWSPMGKRIAFISGDGVQVTDLAGRQPKRLTGLKNITKLLAWSRDGKTIFAASKTDKHIPVLVREGELFMPHEKSLSPDDGNKPEIWKIDAVTGKKERAAYDHTYFWLRYLSPDGTKFVFPVTGETGGFKLWLKTGKNFENTKPLIKGSDAVWMPDGKRVVIRVMNLDSHER